MHADAEWLAFLRSQFSPDASALVYLSQGWFSQAYAFSAGGSEYILRLNEWEVDFKKDAFAAQHLDAPDLPVPPILNTGRFDRRFFYAIAPRCPGKGIDAWDLETKRRLVPALFAALDALRRVDASSCAGWGLMDGEFKGMFPSWRAYLHAVYNQKFSYELEELADTFFEPDLYWATVAAMERLFPFLPPQKWLIHGDFGGHNIISDGERLTGVLDWAEARLGDYLFDLANLEYWSEGIPYRELWREHAARQGLEEPYFEERMRCYNLYSAACDLRLSAHRNVYGDYLFAKAKVNLFL